MVKALELLPRLIAFRCQIHASFSLRRDVLFEAIEALLLSPRIGSAVRITLLPIFRRRFPSLYEALCEGATGREELRKVLAAAEPEDAETVGGYRVYPVDTTIHPRPDAPTLQDRAKVYSTVQGKPVLGHQFSWLGRVIATGQSWFAPREIDRVPTDSTPCAIATTQVKHLAAEATAAAPIAIVGDRHYGVVPFLRAFVNLPFVYPLVRLATNRVLFADPPPKTGKRGHPAWHGAKFCVSAPPPPDRCIEASVLGQRTRISLWYRLHFRTLRELVGVVLRVELLDAEGKPRYKDPWWLFRGGPHHVAPEHLVQMYCMRTTIEHFFRFLKQELGLLAAYTTDLKAQVNWTWVVALAYWQLLLARHLVAPAHHPWDPAARRDPSRVLTPGQVLRAWASFRPGLPTPATPPRPGGKSAGRQHGFQPKPRPRHPVIRKTKNDQAAEAQNHPDQG